MSTSVRNISVLILASAFAIGLSACNTMHGIGKDTEKAGEKIQKESDEHKGDDKDDSRPSAMMPSTRQHNATVQVS